MSYLAYYDKTRMNKNTMQFAYHRDNTYGKYGRFLSNLNSQQQHTATFILTIGDTRKLHFKCCKFDFVDQKEADIEGSHETLLLSHGSLFILHPRDEEPFLRTFFDTNVKSYYKHGNIIFGKDGGLSIGLVFRSTDPQFARHVYRETGQLVLDNPTEASIQYCKYIKKLDEYLADVEHKKLDEDHFKQLYLKLKLEYFNWTLKVDYIY